MENHQYYNFYNNLNMSQYFVFLKNTVKLTKIYFSYNIYDNLSFSYNSIFKLNKTDLKNFDYKYLNIFRTLNQNLKFYSKEKFEYLNVILKTKYLLRDKFKILNANIILKKKIKKFLNRKNLILDSEVLEGYINKISRMIVLFYKTVYYETKFLTVIKESKRKGKKKSKKKEVYMKEIYVIKGLINLFLLNKILFFAKSLVHSLSKKLCSPKKVFLTIGYFSFDNLILRSF